MGRTETGFGQCAAAVGVELGKGGVPGLTSRGPWAYGLGDVPEAVLEALRSMHTALGGDVDLTRSKSERSLVPDFILGSGQIVEVDEIQHFTSDRKLTLELYPADLPLGFDRDEYIRLCELHGAVADRYRAAKPASDFPFAGGRRAQRAFFDATRDLLAPFLTGSPVIRAAAPECEPELAFERVGSLLAAA